MTTSSSRSVRLLVTALALAVFASLVFVNHFLFERFLGHSYLAFWLERGQLITLSLTLIALVWGDLDKHHPDLVSAHPALYLRTCFVIRAGFFLAIANSLPGSQSAAEPRAARVSVVRLLYDTIVGLSFYVLLFLLAVVWFLSVIPAMYFTTLITGAPARLAMFSPPGQVKLVRSSIDSKATGDSFVLSFASKPVTASTALTAGFL
jgi:hypothetical protein